MKTHNNIKIRVEISVKQEESFCTTKQLFLQVREDGGTLSLKDINKSIGLMTREAVEVIREKISLDIEKEAQEEETKE